MISGASEEELELANVIADKLLLQKENQELKKKIELSNVLVTQGTLTEMKLRDEVNRWRKEYQDTYKDVRIEIKEYKAQQKVFINYLEKRYKDVKSVIGSYGSNTDMLYGKKYMLEEILQKYESIIGDDK